MFLTFVSGCTSAADKKANELKAIQEMETKVASIIAQVRADCDSNLYQLARQKADSTRLARQSIKRKKL
jgi:hypothetical protein